jgi:hypothetical protein
MASPARTQRAKSRHLLGPELPDSPALPARLRLHSTTAGAQRKQPKPVRSAFAALRSIRCRKTSETGRQTHGGVRAVSFCSSSARNKDSAASTEQTALPAAPKVSLTSGPLAPRAWASALQNGTRAAAPAPALHTKRPEVRTVKGKDKDHDAASDSKLSTPSAKTQRRDSPAPCGPQGLPCRKPGD